MEDKKLSYLIIIIFFLFNVFITRELIDIIPLEIENKLYIIIYMSTIFTISFSLMIVFFTPLFNGIEKLYIKIKERKIESIEYDYYRDIIENYSMLLLSACSRIKITNQDLFVATLLRLQKTGHIRLENNEVIVLHEENLFESEKSFLKMFLIKEKGIMYNKKQMNYLLNFDLMMDNKQKVLFENKKSIFKIVHDFMSILVLAIFVLLIFLTLTNQNGSTPEETTVVIALFITYFLSLFLHIFAKLKVRDIQIMTKEGKILHNKLIGLRNFIKDFGRLGEKSIEEIKLWDYYLIYAVLFNIKGNLNNEVNEIYIKYIDKYI